MKSRSTLAIMSLLALVFGAASASTSMRRFVLDYFDQLINKNSQAQVVEGRHSFRFDTFGDEQFWGGTLHLHKAIEGAQFGGVGPGVSPATALALGLNTHEGQLTNAPVAEAHGYPSVALPDVLA